MRSSVSSQTVALLASVEDGRLAIGGGRGFTTGYKFEGSIPNGLSISRWNRIPVLRRKHCLIIQRKGIRAKLLGTSLATDPPPTSEKGSVTVFVRRESKGTNHNDNLRTTLLPHRWACYPCGKSRMPQTLFHAGRETSGGVALALRSRIVGDAWAAAPWAFRQAVRPAEP